MPSLINPTATQITANQNRIFSGMRVVSEGREVANGVHLWESGLNEAQQEALIFQKHGGPQADFLYSYMLLLKGAFKPVAGQRYEWAEMGKTRRGVLVDAVSAAGNPTITVSTTSTELYVRPNWRLNSAAGNQQFHVDSAALSGAGGTLQIVLSKIDGTNFVAADIGAGDTLGYSNAAFAEGSGQPTGRTWTPERKTNKTTITKETYELTGDALTTEAELLLKTKNGAIWAHSEQLFTMKEHKRDVASVLLWSQESADDATTYSSRGILRDLFANGQVAPYNGSADEADLQDGLLMMNLVHQNKEFLGMTGDQYMRDIQNGLKEYALDGAVNYGSFNGKTTELKVGLNIVQYSFMNKVLNFREYEGFNDPDQTGSTAAGASATNIDYRNCAVFLNMGQAPTQSGTNGSYVSFKYKAFNGVNRSMVVAYRPGMTGRVNFVGNQSLMNVADAKGGSELLNSAGIPMVATDVDKDSFYLLSQIGPCLIDVENSHFFMRQVA